MATYIDRSDKKFDGMSKNFTIWSSLITKANGIFVVEILNAQEILSPAYDDGADEELLKAEWLAKYNTLLSQNTYLAASAGIGSFFDRPLATCSFNQILDAKT